MRSNKRDNLNKSFQVYYSPIKSVLKSVNPDHDIWSIKFEEGKAKRARDILDNKLRGLQICRAEAQARERQLEFLLEVVNDYNDQGLVGSLVGFKTRLPERDEIWLPTYPLRLIKQPTTGVRRDGGQLIH